MYGRFNRDEVGKQFFERSAGTTFRRGRVPFIVRFTDKRESGFEMPSQRVVGQLDFRTSFRTDR